jgi:UDP-N-acetylmuramate dehydrogenase
MSAIMDHAPGPAITHNAPIRTWFGIGGGADRFAKPRSVEELMACLREDSNLRVLGDGANLLVDDAGVSELVVELCEPAWSGIEIDASTGVVRAGAGTSLPRLIKRTIDAGLAGIEGLGGIPATLGGAIIMNAGGRYGQIGDAVRRVHALTRAGEQRTLDRDSIAFSYRHSGLNELIITEVELALTPGDPKVLQAKNAEVMAYKAGSQPLKADSAGCVYKNPILPHALPEIGDAGARVSAGMLIDRAGCKGLSVGGATVSPHHANFVVTAKGCRAGDVLALMERTTARVFDAFGVTLEPEIVIWRRTP